MDVPVSSIVIQFSMTVVFPLILVDRIWWMSQLVVIHVQLSMTVVFPLILDICFVDRRSGGCPS